MICRSWAPAPRLLASGVSIDSRCDSSATFNICSRLDARSRPQRRRHRIRFAFLIPFVLSPLGPPFPPKFFFFFPAFSLSPVATLLSLLLLSLLWVFLLFVVFLCYCFAFGVTVVLAWSQVDLRR